MSIDGVTSSTCTFLHPSTCQAYADYLSPCQDNFDCGADVHLADGVCVDARCSVYCEGNEDCPDFDSCTSGRCTP